MVIVFIELFQDTISMVLKNVGTKAKDLKNIISDREELCRGWVGEEHGSGRDCEGEELGGQGAVPVGGSRGRVEESGRGRAVYGKVLGRRIRFVYSKIHRSLEVSEFGQKCPAFPRDNFLSYPGYSRSYLLPNLLCGSSGSQCWRSLPLLVNHVILVK